MNEPPKKPFRGLGRGLDALMPARGAGHGRTPRSGQVRGQRVQLPARQNRASKGPTAAALRQRSAGRAGAGHCAPHGLLEPLIVRRRPGADDFEIIAGERRWRAAQRANLREVLVVVHDVSAKDAYELGADRKRPARGSRRHRIRRSAGPPDQGTLVHPRDARAARRQRSLDDRQRPTPPAPTERRARQGRHRRTQRRPRPRPPRRPRRRGPRHPRRKSDPRPAQRTSNRSARSHRQGQTRKTPKAKKTKNPSTRDLELRLGRKLGTKVEVRDKDGKGELATPPGTNSTNCSKCCSSRAPVGPPRSRWSPALPLVPRAPRWSPALPLVPRAPVGPPRSRWPPRT